MTLEIEPALLGYTGRRLEKKIAAIKSIKIHTSSEYRNQLSQGKPVARRQAIPAMKPSFE